MPSDDETSTVERLHPTSLLFSVGSAAWKLLLPGLIVLFAARGRNYEIWLSVLFLPAVIAALARYLSFRYRLDRGELVIREGILTRNERHIPYARIQNIDLMQNPIHRALGVAQIRIETAGGDEPEANIQVLSLGAIERMRERVFAGRERPTIDEGVAADGEAAAATPAARREILRLPERELLMYGVISNRGLAVVLALWGLAWQAQWQGWDLPGLDRLWETLDVDRMAQALSAAGGAWASPLAGATVVAASVLTFVVLLRVISIGWAIVKLHGYALTRTGNDLRTEFGLFTRRSATIPRHRIQLLTVRATPLHRLFGRLEIRVETAGGAKQDESDSGVSRHLLVPLLRQEELGRLVSEIQPEAHLEAVAWRPVHPKAFRRMLFRSLIVGVGIVTLATLLAGPWGLAGLVAIVPLALLASRLRYKRLAYALSDRCVVRRSGWWTHYVSVARFAKIQVVDLTQNPFDRRYAMATVHADTAGGGRSGHRMRIPYLGYAHAREVLERLSLEAARTEFRW